jgi:hypothetical protein
MKPLFCNKCHKRIIPPKFLMGQNINVQNAMTIKCGDPKCSGHVKYKPETKSNEKDLESEIVKIDN